MKIKYIQKIIVIVFFSVFFCTANLFSQEPNHQIKKIHLIFKTHLDIGFTDLSSKVEQLYIENFIPNTLNIIDQLRAENAEERYVWTVGAWLIWEYLQKATPEAVTRLEAAIRRGDIVWNGVPYTVESEMMSMEHFATCLKLSQQLDRQFGKMTIAAKMTDVPGHTRGIVTALSDAGISLLHIGVNPVSTVPDVPRVCRWRNTDGKEIVLIQDGGYGGELILPDGETILAIELTSDNEGPHSISQIKEMYAYYKRKYPNAIISASTLNDVATDLKTMMDKIPVLTSEIGDTWIYGMGSSPLRIARYRAVSRLFTQWIQSGRMDSNSPETIGFAVKLGMIPEHTWGLDVLRGLGMMTDQMVGLDVDVFLRGLKNYDKYDVDIFNASRHLPEFQRMEQSWAEIDEYLDKAITLLPESLQKEVNRELEKIDKRNPFPANRLKGSSCKPQDHAGTIQLGGVSLLAGELAYQTHSAEDYIKFRDAYNRPHVWFDPLWHFGKPGLENTKAKSATIVAATKNCATTKDKKNTIVQRELQFPFDDAIDSRVLPESAVIEYTVAASGKKMEMSVSLINKPAVRLPEAYLLSFVPQGIQRIMVEKMGFMVDVMDVASGGNRQMHAIDHYLDMVTDKGTVRITSLDAPLVIVGERKMLNYSTQLPDLTQGIHFCIVNNTWGTNFSMWWEGSITYRFIVEVIENTSK